MLTWIREKFGTVMIGGIITFITFVFVFYGVFSPKSTRGLHEGAVAGTVNGDPITISEFNRELNRRIEFFKKLAGDKLTDEQMKAFRLREGVFQELANRKILIQESKRLGMLASDEEVKERIAEIPAFQRDGQFDFQAYKQVLEANSYSPGSFERMMREDLSVQQWEAYFQDRVHVSESEVKKEYLLTQDKRIVKYVVLTPEALKKDVSVSVQDVENFLKDSGKLNLAKMKYDSEKNTEYKDKAFDVVKKEIARDLIASEKTEELQKQMQKLSEQVAEHLNDSKASENRLKALLKPYGFEVKSSGWLSRQNAALPGVGDVKELFKDAFKEKSPINAKTGGKAKRYPTAGRIVVAVVADSETPNLAKLTQDPATYDQMVRTLVSKKSRDLFQDWMRGLIHKAKIDANPAVVSPAES